jgi:hypothetical protein
MCRLNHEMFTLARGSQGGIVLIALLQLCDALIQRKGNIDLFIAVFLDAPFVNLSLPVPCE